MNTDIPHSAPNVSFFVRVQRVAIGVVGCLLAAGFAVTTQGCVNQDVEVVNDPFVGPMHRFVIPLIGGGHQATQQLAVTEAGGRYTLQVTVMEYGASLEVARAGDTAEFLVGTEVLVLQAAGEARPVAGPLYGMTNGTILTQWRVPFVLDRAQAARFASAPLNAFKIPVGSQIHQVRVPESKALKFQTNMALIAAPK